MESAFQEALNLFVRWIHVLAAIMWIGDSFLFMWMDSHLEPPTKDRGGQPGQVVGELYMTHSGGFYEVIKRKFLAKHEMPATLYWFKWESYTTWMSGFLLLFVVYYLNGATYLVDADVSATFSTAQGILLSLGLLIGGWLVYDNLWKSPLRNYPKALAPFCFAALVAIAFGVTQVFSGRAAYLHIGAMMGTIMTFNVFFRIIPGQKAMLAATRAGTPIDTSHGVKAKTRSRHNHYMTLPVLFCMLSNHFPGTFQAAQPWLVLAVVFIFGAGLKYLMNYRGKAGLVVWASTLGAFAAIVVLTSGRTLAVASDEELMHTATSFPKVYNLVQEHCTQCHATVPATLKSAPAGIVLEQPEAIVKYAPRILHMVWVTRAMPFGNKTGMTDEQRQTIAAWVVQGAKMTAAPRYEVSEPTPALRGEAEALYATRCAVCHGPDGRGDGPSAKGIVPHPTNLRDYVWQESISDEDLHKVILKGGAALKKSASMPASLDLEDRPELLTAVAYVVRQLEDAKPAEAPQFERTYTPVVSVPKSTLPPAP